MNTKIVREYRSIAKDKGLYGFYRLKKADLLALLLKKPSEKVPAPPPRASGKERRPVLSVKMTPDPQEMGELEREEMKRASQL